MATLNEMVVAFNKVFLSNIKGLVLDSAFLNVMNASQALKDAANRKIGDDQQVALSAQAEVPVADDDSAAPTFIVAVPPEYTPGGFFSARVGQREVRIRMPEAKGQPVGTILFQLPPDFVASAALSLAPMAAAQKAL